MNIRILLIIVMVSGLPMPGYASDKENFLEARRLLQEQRLADQKRDQEIAQQTSERLRQARSDWDRKWHEDEQRRKAIRSGNYQLLEIYVR